MKDSKRLRHSTTSKKTQTVDHKDDQKTKTKKTVKKTTVAKKTTKTTRPSTASKSIKSSIATPHPIEAIFVPETATEWQAKQKMAEQQSTIPNENGFFSSPDAPPPHKRKQFGCCFLCMIGGAVTLVVVGYGIYAIGKYFNFFNTSQTQQQIETIHHNVNQLDQNVEHLSTQLQNETNSVHDLSHQLQENVQSQKTTTQQISDENNKISDLYQEVQSLEHQLQPQAPVPVASSTTQATVPSSPMQTIPKEQIPETQDIISSDKNVLPLQVPHESVHSQATPALPAAKIEEDDDILNATDMPPITDEIDLPLEDSVKKAQFSRDLSDKAMPDTSAKPLDVLSKQFLPHQNSTPSAKSEGNHNLEHEVLSQIPATTMAPYMPADQSHFDNHTEEAGKPLHVLSKQFFPDNNNTETEMVHQNTTSNSESTISSAQQDSTAPSPPKLLIPAQHPYFNDKKFVTTASTPQLANDKTDLSPNEDAPHTQMIQSSTTTLKDRFDALKDTINQGKDYQKELDNYVTTSGDNSAYAQLNDYAHNGLPTEESLQHLFPEVGDIIVQQAQDSLVPTPRPSTQLRNLWESLQKLIIVRSLKDTGQNTPSDIAARMQNALKTGHLEQVIAEWETLPPHAQDASVSFIQKVEARLKANLWLRNTERKIHIQQ